MTTIVGRSDSSQTYKFYDVDAAVTISPDDCPCVVTNISSAGTIVVTLEGDKFNGGEVIEVVQAVAQITRFEPGASSGFYINGAKQTDGKYIGVPAVINNSCTIIATNTNDFLVKDEVGTILVEA